MLQPPDRQNSRPPLTSPDNPSEHPQTVKHKGFSIRALLESLKHIHKKSFWLSLFSLPLPRRKVTPRTVQPKLVETRSPEDIDDSQVVPGKDTESNALKDCRLERQQQLRNLVDALCREDTADVMKALFHYRKSITSEFTILNKELRSEDFASLTNSGVAAIKISEQQLATLRKKTRYLQNLSISLRALPGFSTDNGKDLMAALTHTASGSVLSSRFALDGLLQRILGKKTAEQQQIPPPNRKLAMECLETLKTLKTDVEAASKDYVMGLTEGNVAKARRSCKKWFDATKAYCQTHELHDNPESVVNQMMSPTRYMPLSDQVEDALWHQTRSARHKIPRLFASLHQLHDELPDNSPEKLLAHAAIVVNDTLCKRMDLADNSRELVARLKARPDPGILIELRGDLN